MALETSRFDAADYLKTGQDVLDFLVVAFEEAADDADGAAITSALGTAARARGMSELARQVGQTREGLYKALSRDGNPTLSTLLQVLRALGLRLSVAALDSDRAAA